jgi:Ca2+-binding EF-hand superfamily protein
MTVSVSHELYNRKISHVFDMLDVTKDTYVTESDVVKLAAGISQIMPGLPNPQKSLDFKNAMLGWWRALLPVMNVQQDGMAGREEFCGAMVEVILEQGRFEEVFQPVAVTWFRLYDADDSDSLSLEEFHVLSKALEISPADTEAGFRKFDVNGDGELSEEEFIEVARQFYASEDPDAAGNWLYGPL